MENEIKNCPFCGGESCSGTVKYSANCDIVKLNGQSLFHFVNCVKCGANNEGLIGHRTSEKAIEAWNQRV